MILEFVALKFLKWKNTNYKCWFFSLCSSWIIPFVIWDLGFIWFWTVPIKNQKFILSRRWSKMFPHRIKSKGFICQLKGCFICPWYHPCINIWQKNLFFQWLHNNEHIAIYQGTSALFFPSNHYNVNYAYDSRARVQKASHNHYCQTLLEGIWNTTKLLDRKLKFCIL